MDVLSNLASAENANGLMTLREVEPQNTFSQDLLNSAERIGLYLSSLLEELNITGDLNVATQNLGEIITIASP